MCKATAVSASASASASHKVYWRWGSLRFGFHGVWALLTMAVTMQGIITDDQVYVWPAVITNEVLAIHAYTLLDKVPLSTKIIPGFVAPHREAFKRTIAMMHYTNLRLIQDVLPLVLFYPLLVLAWKQFLPFGSDFRNGNTWVFVIPMFCGVTLDTTQSLVRRHYWDLAADMIPPRWLLGVHMSAMSMAFAFTLGFRGIIRIQYIYFGAVFFVALIFVAECWLILKSR
jgi:hypothetical protein